MNTSDVFHPFDQPEFDGPEVPNPEHECQCFPVPEEYWTTHYGAVDPATMFEPNPACPEHFPENFTEDGDSPAGPVRLTRNAEGVHVPEDSGLREGDRIHYDPREYARASAERLANRPLIHEMLRAAENTPSPIRYASDTAPTPQEGDTVNPDGSITTGSGEHLSAREVLASCDHSRFGTVTRKDDGGTWVSACSGCRATLGPATFQIDPGTGQHAFEFTVDARGALRDWADRAEDYLAQENPPLPPITFAGIPVVVDETVPNDEIRFVQDGDVSLTVRIDPPGEDRLHSKYRVEKRNDPEGKHTDCRFFVLDLDHDPTAALALRAYADAIRSGNPEFAEDLDAMGGGRR